MYAIKGVCSSCVFSVCFPAAACTNHVPVITTLLRGGQAAATAVSTLLGNADF